MQDDAIEGYDPRYDRMQNPRAPLPPEQEELERQEIGKLAAIAFRQWDGDYRCRYDMLQDVMAAHGLRIVRKK